MVITGGLFDRANEAKIATIKGQYNERLSLVAADEYIAREGDIEVEQMVGRLKEERNEGREQWIKPEAEQGIKLDGEDGTKIIVTSKEDYIFYVIVNENGGVEVITGEEKIAVVDTEKPVINISEIKPDSVTFTSTDNVGIVAYTVDYGNVVPTTWTEIDSTITLTQTVKDPSEYPWQGGDWHLCNLYGYEEGYWVWVKDLAGNVSKEFIEHDYVDMQLILDFTYCYNYICSCGSIEPGPSHSSPAPAPPQSACPYCGYPEPPLSCGSCSLTTCPGCSAWFHLY